MAIDVASSLTFAGSRNRFKSEPGHKFFSQSQLNMNKEKTFVGVNILHTLVDKKIFLKKLEVIFSVIRYRWLGDHVNPLALAGVLVDSILMRKSSMILLRIFLEKMLCPVVFQASGVRPAPLALLVDLKKQRQPVEF